MIRFVVKNPLFVNMVTVFVIVLGIFLGSKLNREVFPSIDFGFVIISTSYPGATPEVVEKTITTPIEDAVANVSGIKSIESTSAEGASRITIQAESDIEGYELDRFMDDIKTEVDKVTDLPEDAKDPTVTKRRPQFPVATVVIGGDVPEETLRATAQNLQDEIEIINGVSTVTLTGYRDREMHVYVDPRRMEAADVSLTAIADAIRKRNVNLPAGSVDVGTKEIMVRTTGETETAEDIGGVIVSSGKAGVVYVRDVAMVVESFVKESSIGRLDGSRSVNLSVTKNEDGDVVKIVDDIKKLIDEKQSIIPKGATLKLVDDHAKYVERRQNTLLNDGMMGLILVVLVIFLFLGFQFSIWSAMSIPLSFLGTMIYMYLAGITMNLLSMFALILALGEIADNAIVVTENFFRYREMGYSNFDASTIGTREVAIPVIASKVTNIAAYIPLLFLGGIFGKFLKAIPVVVIVAFVISGIQAFLILPSNLNQFIKTSVADTKDDFRSWWVPMREGFGRLLEVTLKRRYLVFVIINIVSVITLIIGMMTLHFVLRGKGLEESFSISAANPVDTNLSETDRIMKKIEAIVAADIPKDEVSSVTTSAGVRSGRRFSESGSYVGSLTVELTEHGYTDIGAEKIVEGLRGKTALIPGPTYITYDVAQEGPPTGSAVSVEIKGDDYKILESIADEVTAELKKMRGVTSISSNYRKGKQEITIDIDEYAAKRLGLSASFVGNELRYALSGADAGTIYRGSDDIDITVEFAEPFQTPVSITNLTVPTSSGNRVPVSGIATISREAGLLNIYHSDRKRTITISADVVRGETTSPEVNKALMEKLGTSSKLHSGYTFNYSGEYEDTQESSKNLIQSFIIALSIIYGALMILYRSTWQPFVIMMAIPYAFVGVIFGLFIMGIDLSMNAAIGIIALMGVVVNDTTLLVDFINRAKSQGASTYEAVVESRKVRLRPIVLTTLTTLLGVLPMAFGLGGDEPYLAPMAITMFWGVLFSTLLSLFLVPCLYMIIDDIQQKFFKKKA
jgi:multidrug efflux pump subunit AcrB